MDKLQEITNRFLGQNVKKEFTLATTGALKKYEQALETGEYLNLSFERADATTGDLILIDGDTTVFMKAEHIRGRAYDVRYRAQMLEEEYCVKVLSVDKSNHVVYVSHQAAREEERVNLEQYIHDYLKKDVKEPMIVKGKVQRIQRKTVSGKKVDTGVWIDICGVGIPGFIYIGDWKKTFTESLQGKVRYGDIVDVILKEYVPLKKGMYYFSCSRKELTVDPWESRELADKFHKGDIVKITCISKKENFWYGMVNGLSDIYILAEYPSKRHTFSIIEGMTYLGTIYHVDIPNRMLKARVFRALPIFDEETEREE